MQNVTVTAFRTTDLAEILDSDEVLLWSGRPCYGRKFFQFAGHERLMQLCLFIGGLAMWSSLFLIDPINKENAIFAFAIVTLCFIGLLYFAARTRKLILNSFVYLVTNRRAILVRGGKNWRFISMLFAVSCPHSTKYPYKIISSHPYQSLQIGNLLSGEQVQPFGFGISHPGQPFLWNRIFPPVMFEYIDNAAELLELIQTNAMDQKRN